MARPPAKSSVPPPLAPAAAPRGPSGPLPFVGRQAELAELRRQLADVAVVAVHGALGVGATRLVGELGRTLAVPCTSVGCLPDDRAPAVMARIERALRLPVGGVAAALTEHARVLVLDDLHHLGREEQAALIAPLLLGPTALGRVVVIGREPLSVGLGAPIGELELAGLSPDDARALWARLDEAYGAADGLDAALARTRGIPLALSREHARIRLGAGAWQLTSLPPLAQDALAALAVLRQPAGPAALAAILGEVAPEQLAAALATLVGHALLEPLADGRLALHDAIRGDVLAELAPTRRAALANEAARVLAATGPGVRPAWRPGDDGALGGLDAVDRVREVVWQRRSAGELGAAADHLLAHAALASRPGAAGELETLGATLIGGHAAAPGALDAPRRRALAGQAIELAIRGGRYAEALERAATAPGALAGLVHAELTLAAADVAPARRALLGLVGAGGVGVAVGDDDTVALARAALVELELLAGDPEAAAGHLAAALELAQVAPLARTRLLLARAELEAYRGELPAVRTTLGRAAGELARARGAAPDARGLGASELGVIVDARRAATLAREGRLGEATTALDAAEAAARDLDAVVPADEVQVVRAQLARRRGDTNRAALLLRAVIRARRDRGDELGALRTELDLAELELARGAPAAAAELAGAALSSATRRGLGHLAARARAAVAAIDLLELRVDAARGQLEALHGQPALDATTGAQVVVLLATARALAGQRAGAVELAQRAGLAVRDELERTLATAEVALVAGDLALALTLARDTAALAERGQRGVELAAALVIVARLELARGDRGNARAAATRAAREAAAAGVVRPRVHALLALAALARDDGEATTAVAYARDASDLAVTAGLPVERLVAHAALDAIAGHETLADPSAPSAATMAAPAIEGAARLLADLGLTALRPFRVIDADGVPSDVADADPEILRLPSRALAVDGVREAIWRHGQELADLRRRSLLKRLLFLFASAPGKVFSKEAIVQAVWNVEYHPLRHDAALFTNIMRIRRLLGEDGSEIIRVTEDGYRFVPPRDFVFVTAR